MYYSMYYFQDREKR